MNVSESHGSRAGQRRSRHVYSLDRISGLSDAEKARLKEVTKVYAFRANEYYLGLINWNDPDDPIRRLVIPHEAELVEWGDLDASKESKVTVGRGVQHKYGTTVLLLVHEACAAFCRYCFRKRLFMNHGKEDSYDLEQGFEYIRRNADVDNVLLTGGDPMVLRTPQLERILRTLREIEHVRIIRIGSKMPAYDPYRFLSDGELFRLLQRYSLPDKRIYMMCHFDHPRELTPQSREVIDRLIRSGVVCVNQNPVVRGISDDPEVMATLWNELSFIGCPQYYVFQGRPTAGNAPYRVPIVEAYRRIEQAKKKCSGLAKRPKFVMSHESGKVEIVGVDRQHIYMKYHRARHAHDEQRFLVCHRDDTACWLDELRPVSGYHNEYYRGSYESPGQSLWDRRLS